MTHKRAPSPTARITRQSTPSERDRALRDYALSAAFQARHRGTLLVTKRRECVRARAETEKVREDCRANQLAASARVEVDKQDLYDIMKTCSRPRTRTTATSAACTR